MLKRWMLAGLALLLTACPRQALPLAANETPAPPLTGQVQWGDAPRLTQATMGEIGNTATVSLIDPTNGQTIATSVTTAGGGFVLKFGTGFVPGTRPYYLEAVKGLQSNQAGRPLARVRTIILNNNGWESLGNAVPGLPVTVTRRTLAVSIAAQYHALSAAQLTTLMGTVDTNSADGSFTDAAGLTATEVTSVWNLVNTALGRDADPMQAIGFDTGTSTYFLAADAFSVRTVSPSSAAVGTTVTVTGSGFSPILSDDQVTLNDATASVTSVSTDGKQLTFTVPPAATSGTLRVKVGTREQLLAFTVPGNTGFMVENRFNPSALTTYPARLDVTAAQTEFWSAVGSTAAKIRAYDAVGTSLPYWVQSFDGTAKTATIFVRVPSVPARSQAAVYLRGDGASDASSFSNTMSKAGAFNGAVGAWRFDEGTGTTTADSSGQSGTGTLMGGATWGGTDGGSPAFSTGSYLSLNGSQYVEVPSSAALKTSYFSMACWINYGGSTSTDNDEIINKENEYEIAVGDSLSPGSLNWALYRNGTWFWTSAGGAIPTGTWTHVAVTYDGRYTRSYVNGVLVQSYDYGNGPTPLDTNDNALRIGARGAPGAAASFFKGGIDDLMIFNRALTTDEVRALYQRRVPSPFVPRIFSF